MVATALPFWMQHPSRSMPSFTAEPLLRVHAAAPGRPGSERASSRCWSTPARPGLVVESCPEQGIDGHEAAWRALATRALEPNVFVHPDFALPALRHLPPTRRPGFLLTWDVTGPAPVLLGLLMLNPADRRLGLRLSAAWSHEQATFAAPLLDRDRAAEALDAMLDALDGQAPDWCGLELQGVPLDGPLMQLIERRGMPATVLERRSRAVVRPSASTSDETLRAAGRHGKELRRQWRRMADMGPCHRRSARSPEAVRTAVEAFLELEARGWKGGRGTALLGDPGRAAFTRAMTRRLASAGQCRIEAIEVDGRPVAMGIVLLQGDRAFFWKTAYDEALARFSPGKQLAAALRAELAQEDGIALVDSCAIPDHTMITHVWPEEMVVADLLVAGPQSDQARLSGAVRRLALVRRARARAKRLVLAAARRLRRGG